MRGPGPCRETPVRSLMVAIQAEARGVPQTLAAQAVLVRLSRTGSQ